MNHGRSDYARVERALGYLVEHVEEQPTLDELARSVGVSIAHFQRMFSRHVGVSPKRFLQLLTLARAKEHLRASASTLRAAAEVGLSSPSRLHDLFVRIERVTPGQWKSRAGGVTVSYGIEPSPLGPVALAAIDGALCFASFLSEDSPHGEDEALGDLQARFEAARFVRDSRAVAPFALALRKRLAGKRSEPLHVLLKGTELQTQVWQALLRIPEGAVTSYGMLAEGIGQPSASRAIGQAVGRNPIAVLIPCHRVVRATGVLGGYRWGLPRKTALLAREAASR